MRSPVFDSMSNRFTTGPGPRESSSTALITHAVDLVMAAACAAGDPVAIAAFEQQHVRSIRPSVSRVALRPDQLDELRQTLRVRLLTGPTPKIRQYKGNGPLGAWIRVTAARIALELQEATSRHGRDVGSDAAMNALVGSDANPELMAAKAQHREMFQRELQRCFRELDEQEKTLLRMHYLHDMGIDEMSAHPARPPGDGRPLAGGPAQADLRSAVRPPADQDPERHRHPQPDPPGPLRTGHQRPPRPGRRPRPAVTTVG